MPVITKHIPLDGQSLANLGGKGGCSCTDCCGCCKICDEPCRCKNPEATEHRDRISVTINCIDIQYLHVTENEPPLAPELACGGPGNVGWVIGEQPDFLDQPCTSPNANGNVRGEITQIYCEDGIYKLDWLMTGDAAFPNNTCVDLQLAIPAKHAQCCPFKVIWEFDVQDADDCCCEDRSPQVRVVLECDPANDPCPVCGC